MMGRSGELSIRIESTQTVDSQKLKLRASKSGAGGDNMGSTVALTVLFGPLGLLKHGKEAKIKVGNGSFGLHRRSENSGGCQIKAVAAAFKN